MSQTCSHIYDTGGICKSFAVRGQRYCVNHLRYRARRLRMAQARARGQRFEFNLPPLESMHAVQSAISQLAEAIACGVIEHHSAQLLLSVLRVASSNLRHPEKWQDSLYHSDQPAPDVDVAAEYGLPADLDLDTAPDVAFPHPYRPRQRTIGWDSPLATSHRPLTTCPNCRVPHPYRPRQRTIGWDSPLATSHRPLTTCPNCPSPATTAATITVANASAVASAPTTRSLLNR